MSKGNDYFETLNQIQGELTDDVLVARMGEVNMVLSELAKSPIWQIVMRDARDMVKLLDDNWQSIPPDSPKFSESRVLKMAFKHLIDLPNGYLQELEKIQEELTKRNNPQEIISKDNDNE